MNWFLGFLKTWFPTGSHSATKKKREIEKSTEGHLKTKKFKKKIKIQSLAPLHVGAVGIHTPSGVQRMDSSPTST